MQALLIFALIVGAVINTGPKQVPTSLCHDPLLGPSMIIYADCGGVPEMPEKRKKEKPASVKQPTEQPVEYVDTQSTEQLSERPVEELIEQPAEQVIEQPKEHSVGQPAVQPVEQSAEKLVWQTNEQSPEQPTEEGSIQRIEQPAEKPNAEKQKCNKGSGNGAEGCDPGNHPEKGNNDENGDGSAQNSKKNKTERATEQKKSEKQKCNKGSGNGAEGCDPGNHPEKGNDDEDGESRPQNSGKNKQQAGPSDEHPNSGKQKCNKGSGNGAEGCDPGNHPEKGNDDEDGESRPQNAKKDKKH